MEFAKSTEEGFQERLSVLSAIFPDTKKLVTSALNQYRRSELARDDILDALALVIATRRDKLRVVPEWVELDSKGLPTHIWY